MAQEHKSIEERYQTAQDLIGGIAPEKLVLNDAVFPNWVDGGNYFWYVRYSKRCPQPKKVIKSVRGNDTGLEYYLKARKEYRLVNASSTTNKAAFNHADLAKALELCSKNSVDKDDLPISEVEISLRPSTVIFSAFNKRWKFNCSAKTCSQIFEDIPRGYIVSPDGKLAVLTRANNLWLRYLDTGSERPLTKDGEINLLYGAESSVWGRQFNNNLNVLWSPDSRKLFTVKRDTRHMKATPFIHHVPQDGSLRPTTEDVRVAYPGDKRIEEFRFLVIDVATDKICEANYHPVPVYAAWRFFNEQLGWWSSGSEYCYFIEIKRYHKVVRVVELDSNSGSTRVLFEECCETQIDLSYNSEDHPTHMPLPESKELIWFSERSGWAHLYLYDLVSGNLKHAITQGNWQVRDVLHYCTKRRELIVQTSGRVSGRNPYYRDICVVNIDTGDIKTLCSSDHEYIVQTAKSVNFHAAQGFGWDINENRTSGVSPDGHYLVTTRSRVDQAPVSLFLNRDGDVLFELEVADTSSLPIGWKWPEPVSFMADDGETELYGVIFRPSNFVPDMKYPVIDYVASCAATAYAPKGSFVNAEPAGMSYLGPAALAELGFVVLSLIGTGTPGRHKRFHDRHYGWAPYFDHPKDHVAGIKQLAKRFSYMDISSVGIYSPYGTPNGLHGLFEHPDVYKVGVIHRPQDARLMPGPVHGEKYEGPEAKIDKKYPEELVADFDGHLFLTHSMQDVQNPPATTFRLVEALQKANKDFDMLMLPNHVPSCSGYITRRSWDYFVTHLLHTSPPKGFSLKTMLDGEGTIWSKTLEEFEA